ncbi:plasmid pRiA4b ORF-3 family protein [Croceicoccus naphthovorans]|uniref:plasmid pRiA4b ORF-3 family protein n=1 Tax=Croceicoccus naphthovorans TaxID=1348774 RepID=UPI001C54FBA9|nr:plasmid pRiA4b ORF-3 family protein [Croceicoccus naphthovorans]
MTWGTTGAHPHRRERRPRRSRHPLPAFRNRRTPLPPEDVGGFPGFEMFLDAMADPSHEEHTHLRRWHGGRSTQTISTSRQSCEGWPPSPGDGRSEKPPTPETESQPDKAAFTHRLR